MLIKYSVNCVAENSLWKVDSFSFILAKQVKENFLWYNTLKWKFLPLYNFFSLYLEKDSEETGSGIPFLDKLVGSRKNISRKQSILELPMVRVNLPDEQTRTGLDTGSLVIKPGFLKQGLTYFLEVKVSNEGQCAISQSLKILFDRSDLFYLHNGLPF